MNDITRRDALKCGIAVGMALVVGRDAMAAKSPTESATPLTEAITRFNNQAASLPFGKEQPPLTEEEVVAAILWLDSQRKEPVTDEEYRALRRVAETRQLPPGADLEVLTGFEPDDMTVFEAWSVRVRMPRDETGRTYGFVIRERMIRSRRIGVEERKVIDKWRQKTSITSFGRMEMMQERADAKARDNAMSLP